MLSRVRTLRFEIVSLVFVGVSVIALYTMVLVGVAPSAVERAAPSAAVEPPTAGAQQTPLLRNMQYAGIHAVSVAGLVELFERADYRLEDVRKGEIEVPRILLDAVPLDFARIGSTAERKRVFIQMALPLVLYVNERILEQRERLIALSEEIGRTGRISDSRDRLWLGFMALLYDLDEADVDALLRRVDVLPPSLALAQGAEESGWGTSRFVREGNAIFGQRIFTRGAGLVPERRDQGKRHEVKAFNRLVDSVAAYIVNLNSHFAYDEFRRARADMRRHGGVIDGYALAGTLKSYSERGEAYIGTIRSIIDTNRLHAFDRARLGSEQVRAARGPDV